MTLSEYVNSPEFRRASSNTAESGLKLFFKGVEWTVKFIADFVRTFFREVFGGR